LETWVDQSFDRIQKEIGKVGIVAIGKNNVVQYLNLLKDFYSILNKSKQDTILMMIEKFKT